MDGGCLIYIFRFDKKAPKMTLEKTIETGLNTFDLINNERKLELAVIADFIRDKNGWADLVFICTHNSRRSHLAQIWAQVAAAHYGFFGVTCYSGGTESTAFFKTAIDALQTQGVQINSLSKGDNPIYAVKYHEDEHPVICYSKKFDDDFNPQYGFAAIMTCDDADKNCPFIAAAGARIPLRYEDPKIADGTPLALEKYKERSTQICREMLYAFSLV